MFDDLRPFRTPSPEAVRAFVERIPMYAQDDDPAFWSADRLRSRQNELLRRQMAWIAEGSAFYQSMFKREGIDAGSIAGVDDLVGIPTTTKMDLMNDSASFRLNLRKRTLYDTTYATVYTTGVTLGVPTRYEYTAHDYFGTLQAQIRCNKLSYYVPGDHAVVAFPLAPVPHIGSPAWLSLMTNASGVSFASGFTGTPYPEFPIHRPANLLVDMIEHQRPQILIGIASFVRRLLADAAAAGRDFSSLRIVLTGGEALTQRTRAQMHDNLASLGAPDVFITANYGFTEGAIPAGACYEGGPMHNSAPDQIFYEVLDEDTLEPVPDGQTGLVALTHLNRRGMPLLRYLLGDVSSISNEQCDACGRIGQSFLISSGSAYARRTKDLIKVKGTLVNPHLVHDAVAGAAGVLEYQLVVTNEVEGDALTPEKVVLRIGVDDGENRNSWSPGGKNFEDIRDAVFNAIEQRVELDVVDDVSSVYDPIKEFKATRVIDRRPTD